MWDFDRGTRVKVIALRNAGVRTKERLDAHGSDGFVFFEERAVDGFNGEKGILLESLCKTSARGEHWMGWIKSDDVDVTPWRK